MACAAAATAQPHHHHHHFPDSSSPNGKQERAGHTRCMCIIFRPRRDARAVYYFYDYMVLGFFFGASSSEYKCPNERERESENVQSRGGERILRPSSGNSIVPMYDLSWSSLFYVCRRVREQAMRVYFYRPLFRQACNCTEQMTRSGEKLQTGDFISLVSMAGYFFASLSTHLHG
jgi:hypothetical protein